MLADRLTVRIGRGHRDWGVADVADGRGARDEQDLVRTTRGQRRRLFGDEESKQFAGFFQDVM